MLEGGYCPHGHFLSPDNVSHIAGRVRCRKCAVIVSRRCILKRRARTGWQPRKKLPTIVRFWKYVSPEPNSGCWLWTAHLDGSGYGAFSVGRDWPLAKKSRVHKAHRVSYEINVGPIPEGLQLDHICRVRSCVNPAHLRPVTAQQNTQYAGPYISAAHRNRKKTHCPKGHPYDEENTAIVNDRGWRRCVICHREDVRRKSARKLEARRAKKAAALHAQNMAHGAMQCLSENAETFREQHTENLREGQ